MQALFTEIQKLSIEELSQLNRFVIETSKSKKALLGNQIGVQLKANMTVTINSPKFEGKKFIVQKVNRTKAVIRLEGTIKDYDAPFNMITIVK